MSRLALGQRKLREARKLLAAVRDENPELRDDTEAALAAVMRAEDRSAEIIREVTGIGRR